jgi:hypothetical protein
LPGDAPPKSPPLGGVVIPPLLIPEEVFAHHGTVGPDGAFESRLLGMRARIPGGFVPASVGDRGDLELAVKRASPSFALAGFQFVMSSATIELETKYLRATMKGLKENEAFRGIPRRYMGKRATRVGQATADTYEWYFPRGGLRMAFAAACRGKATVAVVSVWIDEDGRAAVDDFARSIAMPADDAQVCAYLSQVVD